MHLRVHQNGVIYKVCIKCARCTCCSFKMIFISSQRGSAKTSSSHQSNPIECYRNPNAKDCDPLKPLLMERLSKDNKDIWTRLSEWARDQPDQLTEVEDRPGESTTDRPAGNEGFLSAFSCRFETVHKLILNLIEVGSTLWHWLAISRLNSRPYVTAHANVENQFSRVKNSKEFNLTILKWKFVVEIAIFRYWL